MGSVLLTPPHHSWLFRGSNTVHCRSTQACHGKCFLQQGDKVPASRHFVYLIMSYLPRSSALFCPLSFFCTSLSCTISQTCSYIHFHPRANTNSFNHALTPTLKSYLSHVWTNTSAVAAFTYSNVFSLAPRPCCVKQHACVCFLHATADLTAYRYPSHFSLSPVFHPSMWRLKRNMDLP